MRRGSGERTLNNSIENSTGAYNVDKALAFLNEPVDFSTLIESTASTPSIPTKLINSSVINGVRRFTARNTQPATDTYDVDSALAFLNEPILDTLLSEYKLTDSKGSIRKKASGISESVTGRVKQLTDRQAVSESEAPRQHSRRLRVALFAGITVAATLIPSLMPVDKETTRPTETAAEIAPEKPGQTTASITLPASTTTETTVPEVPMADKPLEILPKESFLTPEGNFVKEDYRIQLPTIGADILGFQRPTSELEMIGELDQTVLDVVRPAATPTKLTPQVEAYKNVDSDFIPTAERYKRSNGDMWYWGDKPAGDYQKTAMITPGSVYPGQNGNAVIFLHGSTKTAGGGDLPALKTGDPLKITLNDGNMFTYKFIKREIIKVDKHGELLPEEIPKLVALGYSPDVTAYDVIYHPIEYKNKPMVTGVICSNPNGTPGGSNGVGAGEARGIYRYEIVDQDLAVRYPAS